MLGVTLRTLPFPAKAMITAYMFCVGVGYLYALGNLALSVGLLPNQIIRHYYGNEATQAALKEAAAPKVAAGASAEEELDLGDDAAPAKPAEEILPVPTFKSLVAEGHFHVLGMAGFFFGLALVALFLEASTTRKTILAVTPFVAIVVDNLALLGTRFWGPHWSFLAGISGTLMALSFLGILVHAISEMWFDHVIGPSRAVVAAVLALSILPVSAHAEELMSFKDAAKRILSGSAKATKLDVTPTDAEKAALKAGGVTPDASYTFLVGRDAAATIAAAGMVIDQQGKEGPMKIGVSLTPDGKVKEAFVVRYEEERGKPVKEASFLDQFKGKSAKDPITPGKDVDIISGATVSSKAVSEAVKRVVVGYKILVLDRGTK